MNSTVAIVQARMGSFRFPGKMMHLLEDRPLVEWVLYRTMKANRVDKVVLATTELESDDVLATVAERLGTGIFRGAEHDVLGRYARAAQSFGASIVVRICADRPLVDPDCIDRAVDSFGCMSADVIFNHISDGAEFWPRGFGAEVLSNERVQWLDKNVDDPALREHVTLYMWKHRDLFNIRPVPCPPSMNPGKPDVRFDVDEPEDLDFLGTLCRGESMDVPGATIIAKYRSRIPPSHASLSHET